MELLDDLIDNGSDLVDGNTNIKVLVVWGMGFECSHIFSDFPTFLLCSCGIKKARIGNPFLIKAICTSILKVLHVSAAVFAEDLDKNDIVFNRLQRRLVGGVYCSHG